MRSTILSIQIFLLSALLSLTLTGCSGDDNPARGNDNPHHIEAIGVRILDVSQTLLVEADGTEVTGSITLDRDGDTGFLTVHFLHPDTGEWYDPEELEEEHEAGGEESHELVVTVGSTEIATATHGEEIEGAPTHWGFRLNGVAAGATTIRIEIYHEDHPDYTSPLIPVTVR